LLVMEQQQMVPTIGLLKIVGANLGATMDIFICQEIEITIVESLHSRLIRLFNQKQFILYIFKINIYILMYNVKH
jgi:hypothetical protein